MAMDYPQYLTRISMLLKSTGFRLLVLFFALVIAFAAYYTTVVPKHFLYSSDVLAHNISVKEDRLNSELRELIRDGIRQYAKNFILRMEDGAEVYSYSYEAGTSGEVYHRRIIPDTVQVLNATVNQGLINFDLRLPQINEALKQVTLRPVMACSVVISVVRTTDNQNDLINCISPSTGQANTLTQYDLFYTQAPLGVEPAQIIFKNLQDVMPIARQLQLNKSGHFGAELEQFSSMLLLSMSIITTSGTLGVEPVTHHARLVVAIESLLGILLLVGYLTGIVNSKINADKKRMAD